MNTDIINYYAKRAKVYEKIYQKPERQPELQSIEKLLQGEFTSQKLLEIACGTGYWTERMAETATSVLATDINSEVIEIAKAKSYPKQNVSFSNADVFSLSRVSSDFTAGFGGFIWSHIPLEKISPFLDTLHSKIKRQGKIIFIDNNYVEGNSTLIYTKDKEGNTYQLRKLEDGTSHLVLKNFPTEAEIRQVLEGAAINLVFKRLKYFWYLMYNRR